MMTSSQSRVVLRQPKVDERARSLNTARAIDAYFDETSRGQPPLYYARHEYCYSRRQPPADMAKPPCRLALARAAIYRYYYYRLLWRLSAAQD